MNIYGIFNFDLSQKLALIGEKEWYFLNQRTRKSVVCLFLLSRVIVVNSGKKTMIIKLDIYFISNVFSKTLVHTIMRFKKPGTRYKYVIQSALNFRFCKNN